MSITTFEGAAAVFTFFVAAVSLFALVATMIHEKHSYADPEPKKLKH